MKIEIITRQYEFTWGKPRGAGQWAFDIGGEIFWAKPNQLYSAACKEARAKAAAAKIRAITLLT
jgi:hypothetical protein